MSRPSIELDYEEALLSLSESAHPFATISAEALLAEFWTEDLSIDVSRVKQGCITLQLGNILTLSSGEYLESLKTDSDQLDTCKFLYSCLLLGQGPAEQKLQLWMQFFTDQSTQDQFQINLQSLIKTSAEVLPLLAAAKFSPEKLSEYVASLSTRCEDLVSKATQELVSSRSCISKAELREQFDRHPKYFQLFTPNLTRLLLLQTMPRVQHTRETSFAVQHQDSSMTDFVCQDSVEPVLVQVNLAGRTEDLIVYLDEDPEEVAAAFANKLRLTPKERKQVLESIYYIRHRLAEEA